MKLIIHTGQGKTGTTSIQKSLSNNRDFLNKNKIFYVGLNFEYAPEINYDWQKPFGWPELKALPPEELTFQLYDIISRTLKELESQGFKTVIWSNESLFFNFKKLSDVLNRLKTDFEVETITFIRRHDKWLKSAYLQWGVKHKTYIGAVKGFTDWVKFNGIAFADDMSLWAAYGRDNCYFVNFDNCGDASKVIFEFLGLSSDGITVRVNESPSSIEIALYALYNSLFSKQVLPYQLGRLLKNYDVNNLQIPDVDIDDLFPTVNDLEVVLKDSKSDLEAVNNLLEQHGGMPLTLERNKNKVIKPNVTSDKMIAVLLHIVNEQDKKIEQLYELVKK